jgi:hypothetical protein
MHATQNDVEMRLVQDTQSGKQCDLALEWVADKERHIRAELIKQLLLSISANADPADAAGTIAGVRILNAIIDGPLDLSDAAASAGGVLPSLMLEDCTITDLIDISYTSIRRLSLAGSRITHLRARNTRFEGPVDLRRVTSAEQEGQRTGAGQEGLCWVELQGARIGGSVYAFESHLCAPPAESKLVEQDSKPPYALNLGGACIEGSLTLQPGFTATGGVCILGAQIAGDLWLSGAQLRGYDQHAFNAQRAVVQGHAVFSEFDNDKPPFWSIGQVYMFSARIGGGLWMNHVFIQRTGASGNHALNCHGMEVGGTFTLGGSISGFVALDHCRIRGGLTLGTETFPLTITTQLDEEGEPPVGTIGFDLRDTTIDLTFVVRSLAFNNPKQLVWRVALEGGMGAARERELSCYPGWRLVEVDCATFFGKGTVFILDNQKDRAILLDGHSIRFRALNRRGQLKLDTPEQAAEYLRLFSSNIGSDSGGLFVVISGRNGAGERLAGRLTEHETSLQVRRTEFGYQAEATILHSRRLYRCSFNIGRHGDVEMTNDELLETLPDSTVFRSPFRVQIQTDGVNIKDWRMPDLFEGGYRVLNQVEASDVVRRVIEDPQSDNRLRPRIDLTGVHAGALDDVRGSEWGYTAALNLTGFQYDRIVHQQSMETERAVRSKVLAETVAPWRRRLKAARSAPDELPSFFVDRIVGPPITWLKRARRLLRFHWTGMPQVVLDPAPWRFWLPTHNRFINKIGMKLRRKHRNRRIEDENDWPWRLNWLALQYATYFPNDRDFHPQPYEQLASVYRQAGQIKDARRILSEKLTIERKYRANLLVKPVLWIAALLFDYGLSPIRALATLGLFILLGWFGVRYAVNADLLVIDTTPTSSVVLNDRLGVPVSDSPGLPELSCRNEITPLLYAADVFIPLLDLREEPRCQVRGFNPITDARPWQAVEAAGGLRVGNIRAYAAALLSDPRAWGIGKALYAGVGWLIVSVTILTISGVLRRQVEH